MHEAMFYEKLEDGAVRCNLCSHRCRVADGKRGLCGVRENRGGVLVSLVYGQVVAEHNDPIEKKPLFHFLPGSKTWSIATVGCNFRCRHCQNFEISQYPHLHGGRIPGSVRTPEEVVAAAKAGGARSLSYTYVEPTVFYEFARDCMVLAHEAGLANVFVSNGYMTPEVIGDLAGLLDAINVDVKALRDDFYRRICSARVEPVLESVRLLRQAGIWVEVTTLLIPGLNDSDEELAGIARFVAGVDAAIPWHVTAFRPTYKLTDRGPTPPASLQRAREIGLREGVRYVYEGNIPGSGGESTRCPQCGRLVVERLGFLLQANVLRRGCCPDCGHLVDGVWAWPLDRTEPAG